MFISKKDSFIFFHIPKTAGTSFNNFFKIKYQNTTEDPPPPIHHMRAKDYLKFHGFKEHYFKFAVVRNPFSRLLSAYLDFLEKRNKFNFDESKSFYIHKPIYRKLIFRKSITINESLWINVDSKNYFDFDSYCKDLISNKKSNIKFLDIKKNSTFDDFCNTLASSGWLSDIHFSMQKDFLYSENNECLVDFIGRYEDLNQAVNVISDRLGFNIKIEHLRKSNYQYEYKDFYNLRTKKLIEEIFKDDLNTFNYVF